jgi:hypothetical protein
MSLSQRKQLSERKEGSMKSLTQQKPIQEKYNISSKRAAIREYKALKQKYPKLFYHWVVFLPGNAETLRRAV